MSGDVDSADELPANLAALRVEAPRADPAPEPKAEPAQPASEVLPATLTAAEQISEWREVIDFLCDELIEHHPRLAAIYTPAKRQRLAERIHPVAVKYGIDKAWEWLARWMPEFWLAVALWPMARDTVKVIRGSAVAPAKAEPEPVAKPKTAPPSEGVGTLKIVD